MLTAGLLHASWHGLVKSSTNHITLLAGMGAVAALIAICALPFVTAPPPEIWPVLAASVVLHVGYKLCLARAYARGDLGQAFPLARGAVPLFSTGLAFLIFGQSPTQWQCVAIGLISAGLLTLAIGDTSKASGRLLLAAAGAGLAVAGYSVLDSYGTRLYGDWLGFTVWLVMLDNISFLALARLMVGQRIWGDLLAARSKVFMSGVLGVLSFFAFLWALSFHPVGPVSALRETSVVFAVLIGSFAHHENLSRLRLVAALLVLSGIALFAV